MGTNIDYYRKEFIKSSDIKARNLLNHLKITKKVIKEFKRNNRFMYSLKYIEADENDKYRHWNTVVIVYWPIINPDAKGNRREFAEGEIYVNPKYKNILEGFNNEKV